MFETLQNKMSDLEAGDLRGLCASNQPSCDHELNGFEDLFYIQISKNSLLVCLLYQPKCFQQCSDAENQQVYLTTNNVA